MLLKPKGTSEKLKYVFSKIDLKIPIFSFSEVPK